MRLDSSRKLSAAEWEAFKLQSIGAR
jgi:hypothetical protein